MTSWTSPTPADHARAGRDQDPIDGAALLRGLALAATRARLTVLDQLGIRQPLVSALGLHRRLERGRPVGLATVYRTLGALTDAGLLHTFLVRGELMYRRCSPGHHHHIVCIRCGTVWEEHPDAVEHWITDVAARHARLIDHRADIFVICQHCDDLDPRHPPEPTPGVRARPQNP